MTNNSRCNYNMKKSSGRRNYFTGRNIIEWYQRTRGAKRIRKGGQTILGRKWNCLCGQKNLCTEQQKNQEEDFIGKS